MGSVSTKVGGGMSASVASLVGGGTIGTAAAAGSSATDATALAADSTYVTGADGTKGVKLFDCEVGSVIHVFNNASSALKVYPPASQQINNLTATTGNISVAANKGAMLLKLTNNTWGAVYA